MWESLGNILLGIVLAPVALVVLGAIIIQGNGGAGESFYGTRNPSFWQYILAFFGTGVVSAILFGLIGGLSWAICEGFQHFNFVGGGAIIVATLISVVIVVVGCCAGAELCCNAQEKRQQVKLDINS